WRVMSPCPSMGSYPTLSPLLLARRPTLCCTVSRISPGGCYPPSCPVEPGRSSVRSPATRPSGRPIRVFSLLLRRLRDLQIERHIDRERAEQTVGSDRGRFAHCFGCSIRLFLRDVQNH